MSAPSSRGHALLQLCRFSNMPTVWSNVILGWILAGGNVQPSLFLLILGATCLYFGGTTLNDACDAAFDRQYRPERPIPSGIFTRSQVTWIGIGWMLAGSAIVLLAGASPLLLAILIALIVGYDVIHKKTRWAGVPMGLARGTLVLLAASAAAPCDYSAILPIIWAAAHTLYIIGLTWNAAGESGPKKRDYPLAQSLLLLTPIAAIAVMPFFDSPTLVGFVLMIFFVIVWLLWNAPALPLRRRPLPPPKAIPRLLAGIILTDALALCLPHPVLAFVCLLLLFPLALWLQKSFAAT
ncbi:UbiA family prenyltransferase [Cerasicoccus fimbriatus]|uniref:UbiA family prenyltransferase n=1 Tax=Cerasicoccus fimbriatus TaxID=3014554 RepID=UPI0022B5E49D|nr:UbiA family prenyltransferase [Cerasicoccus sp. TK19100]